MVSIFEHKNILNASRKHAESEYPKEAVGIIYERKFIRLENIAADPINDFKVDMQKIVTEFETDKIQAVIHSHVCDDKVHGPSAADIQAQIAWGIPFGIQLVAQGEAGNIIWFGDDAPILPYEGRPYIFGAYDCFSIAKDYFKKERGVSIKDYPRDEERYDLFLDHIQSEGFERLPDAKHLQEGDVVLVSLRSVKPNHCLVCMGNGRGLHHPYGHKSKIEPIGPYIDTEKPWFHSAWRLKE